MEIGRKVLTVCCLSVNEDFALTGRTKSWKLPHVADPCTKLCYNFQSYVVYPVYGSYLLTMIYLYSKLLCPSWTFSNYFQIFFIFLQRLFKSKKVHEYLIIGFNLLCIKESISPCYDHGLLMSGPFRYYLAYYYCSFQCVEFLK